MSSFSLWEILQNEGDELDVNDEVAMLPAAESFKIISASTGSLNNSDLYSGE